MSPRGRNRRNKRRAHQFPFPLGGIHKGKPNPEHPPFTTPDCVNVRPRDIIERRERGGVRPGLIKAFKEQIGGAGTDLPIRMLSKVSQVVQDGFNFFADPWSDEFDTTIFLAIWSEPLWIGAKPTIEDERPGRDRSSGVGLIKASNGLFDETSGLIRAFIDIDITQDYEVAIDIAPRSRSHHGTYQIFLRMDSNAPDVTDQGVSIDLVMTDNKGSYSGTMTENNAGSPTAYTLINGGLGLEFIFEWGSSGSGDGQFQDAAGIRWNPFVEKLYVVDQINDRVQVFDKDGTFSAKWGTNGSGDGQLNGPEDVAFAPNGEVYITDRANHRVQIFAESTHAFVAKFGTFGTGDGEFSNPWGIEFLSDGKIVVAEQLNHRIQIFNSDRTFNSKFGSSGSGDGQFNQPLGVAIDSNDLIYVVDSQNDRVQVFDSSGTFIYKFGTTGTGDGEFNTPRFIGFFGEESLYITDQDNDRISKWVRRMSFVSEIDVVGDGLYPFTSSSDKFTTGTKGGDNTIHQYTGAGALDAETGPLGSGDGQLGNNSVLFSKNRQARDSSDNLFVADSANNRIVKFTSAFAFSADVTLSSTNIVSFAIDSSNRFWVADVVTPNLTITVKVYNSAGDLQFTVGTGATSGAAGAFSAFNLGQIAFDSSGNAFILDSGNGRVQKFNSSGVYQSQFKAGGGSGLAIDSDDRIYVSDGSNIKVYNSDGVFQFNAVTNDSDINGKSFSPGYMQFDAGGILHVKAGGRVVELGTPRFVFQEDFGSSGTELGQFAGRAAGITINQEEGYGFVGDGFGGERIQRINLSDISESLPGTLRALVSGDNIKVFWRGFQIMDQNVTASTKKKIGIGMDCTETDGKCVIEAISIGYFLTETPRRIHKLAVSSAGGQLWRESNTGVMENVVSNLSLNADVQLQAADFNQKLYIADYGDDKSAGSTGEVVGSGLIFDANSVLDWTALSISTNDDVLSITGDTVGSSVPGVYPISNLTGRFTDLVLNGDMDTTASWTEQETGWTVDDATAGKANSTGAQSGDSDLGQTPASTLVSGKKYEVIFTTSARSQGNITAVLGGTEGTDRDGNTTYTETITAGAGGDIQLRADVDWDGDVDNFSVKAIAITLGVSTGGVSGAASHTWRIARGPKVYDPAAGTLALWLSTTGKGDVPIGNRLLDLYRGRMSLTGDPALPNVWYHGRQDDPFDWDYTATEEDAARPILGQNADFGVVGEGITCQIPFSDDYLIFASATTLWVLRGDAAFTGQIDNISRSVGIISGNAFSFGPSGEIVFLGRDGIYILAPGADTSPVSISDEYLPDSLRNIDPKLFDVSLEYDIIEQGLHIYITPTAGGAQKYFWMDWKNKRFWPAILKTSHEPMETLSFTSIDSTLSVLHGCRDGYIRRYSRGSSTDETFEIKSHILIGPFYLGGGEFFEGIMKSIQGVLANNSGNIRWKVFVAQTHHEAIIKATGDGVADAEGVFTSDLNYLQRVDRRGGSAVIRLEGIPLEKPWALERIIGISVDSGIHRKRR